MESTMITAMAIILGSVVGAIATFGTTWLTHRTQAARTKTEVTLRDRQALYGEFITEASRLTVDAFTNQLERPATFVTLYGILGRIRLVADGAVLASAEACCRQIVELYAKPNMTIDQIRDGFEHGQIDPIKEFSTTCRAELLGIAQGF